MVSKAHAFSEACAWEAEAEGPEVLSQSGLYSRTHLVNKQTNNLNEARTHSKACLRYRINACKERVRTVTLNRREGKVGFS